MPEKKHRLVTRSDFDGLVCAVLLKQLGLIDDIKFVHPKDMQDGLVDITSLDIVTNLPYVKHAHLVFDHHLSETIRNPGERPNHIIDPSSSAARVVREVMVRKFPSLAGMMEAVDKGDSAIHTKTNVRLDRVEFTNFLMDARTTGRFKTLGYLITI